MRTRVRSRCRYGDDVLGRGTFFLVIGAILAWGFFLTGTVATTYEQWIPTKPELIFVVILAFVGLFISMADNALVAFFGFNVIMGSFGALLGPVIHMMEIKTPGIVAQTAYLTAYVSAAMAVSGLLFPRFYQSIAGALFTALCAITLIAVLGIFIPELRHVQAVNYIAAGVFALYIGYYMWVATEVQATFGNAVRVAIGLYLSAMNLFEALLELKSSD